MNIILHGSSTVCTKRLWKSSLESMSHGSQSFLCRNPTRFLVSFSERWEVTWLDGLRNCASWPYCSNATLGLNSTHWWRMDRFMTSRRSQWPTTRGRKKENRQSSLFITINLFPCCRFSSPSSTPAEGPDPSLSTLFHYTGKTLTFCRKIARCLGERAIDRFYPHFDYILIS